MKKFYILLLFVSTQFISCDTTEPLNGLLPGRRDYVWTADTLKADDFFGITDMWGTSPNSIWITASGTSGKDCLWHYDGVKWTESKKILSSTLNTVFGVKANDIWIGDSFGTIWRNTGKGWQKFQEIKVDGYDRIVIASIYGTSEDNLYAVGAADNYDGSGYKAIILKYDGTEWKLLKIPDMRVGFHYITKANDNYIIEGSNDDKGFLDKIFVFDGVSKLKEIYSEYYWPGIYKINSKIYVSANRKIYKYNNYNLQLWKEFAGTSYTGVVLGRSELDFFGAGYEGIMHYNGIDLKVLYPTHLDLSAGLIFKEDVFLVGLDRATNTEIIIRGTLKN